MQTQFVPLFPTGSSALVPTGSGSANDTPGFGAFSAHLPDPDANGAQDDPAQSSPADGDPVLAPWTDFPASLATLRVENPSGVNLADFSHADSGGIGAVPEITEDLPDIQVGQAGLDASERSALPPDSARIGPLLPSALANGSSSSMPGGASAMADGGVVFKIVAPEPAVVPQSGLQDGAQAKAGVADPAWMTGLAIAAPVHLARLGPDLEAQHAQGNNRLWQGEYLGEDWSNGPKGPLAKDDRTVSAGNAGPTIADLMGNALTPAGVGLDLAHAGAATSPELVFVDVAGESGLLSGPGAGSASGPGAGTGAPSVSAQPPVPQLAARLVETLVHSGSGVTEISLSPDELGQVRVTLQADAQNPDRMVVMLNFDRQETLDLFRRHADQLADALRAAGYSGVDIGFGQSGPGQRDNPDTSPTAPTEAALADMIDPDPVAHPLRLSTGRSLDLRL